MSAHSFRSFSIWLFGLSSFGSLALQSVIHDEQHKVEKNRLSHYDQEEKAQWDTRIRKSVCKGGGAAGADKHDKQLGLVVPSVFIRTSDGQLTCNMNFLFFQFSPEFQVQLGKVLFLPASHRQTLNLVMKHILSSTLPTIAL